MEVPNQVPYAKKGAKPKANQVRSNHEEGGRERGKDASSEA